MSKITYSVNLAQTGNDEEVIIVGQWLMSAARFKCVIVKGGNGDNADAAFSLMIDGGQVEKGDIKMCGNLEREEFIQTLEVILRELKNI